MIKVNYTGTQQVINNLRRAKNIEPKIRAGLMAGGLVISNQAKENAPYLTGTLKRDIHPEIIEEGNSLEVAIGSNLEYAAKMEFGGSNKAPDGYLRKALDEHGDEARAEVAGAMKKMFG